jgi:prepilin-type N-terminal cleavage/methylation domain-containing protein
MHKRSPQGFTLIELLVVVAILGLVSTIVLNSLETARAKARDVRRLADIREVRTALENYRTENGSYPIATAWRGTCTTFNAGGTITTSGPNGWVPDLAPKYIPVLPVESKPTDNNCYLYRTTTNGSGFIVLAHASVETKQSDLAVYVSATPCSPTVPATATNPAVRPRQPAQRTFAVYTPITGICSETFTP